MQVNQEELESCYQKFQILKLRMSIANKKYRLSKKGMETTKLSQKKWIESKKDDVDYRLRCNLSQKERYHRRVQAKKLLLETTLFAVATILNLDDEL